MHLHCYIFIGTHDKWARAGVKCWLNATDKQLLLIETERISDIYWLFNLHHDSIIIMTMAMSRRFIPSPNYESRYAYYHCDCVLNWAMLDDNNFSQNLTFTDRPKKNTKLSLEYSNVFHSQRKIDTQIKRRTKSPNHIVQLITRIRLHHNLNRFNQFTIGFDSFHNKIIAIQNG